MSSARKSRSRPIMHQPAAQLYDRLVTGIKERIRTAQVRAALAANAELVLHYWEVGRDILVAQEREGWGAKVVARLAADLQREFPKLAGYSARNLKYMRAFAAAWPDRAFNTGGSRRALTKGHIESFEVPLPPLPVQRRIAGILSAYDELIENSQRRIRILEAMARVLYREWFVHFRFPGHEKRPSPAGRGGGEGRAKLVTSPLGDIPKGSRSRLCLWRLQLRARRSSKSGVASCSSGWLATTVSLSRTSSWAIIPPEPDFNSTRSVAGRTMPAARTVTSTLVSGRAPNAAATSTSTIQ